MKTYFPILLFLIVFTACENDEHTDELIECKSINKIPDFSYNMDQILAGEKITFEDRNFGNYERIWEFEGGSPSTSVLYNETVTYTDTGSFDVSLTYVNACDTIKETFPNLIRVNVDPCPADSCGYIEGKFRRIEALYGTLGAEYNTFWFYEKLEDTATVQPLILIYGGGKFLYEPNLHNLEKLAHALVNKGYKVATLKTYFRYYPDIPTEKQRTYRMIRANHSVKAGIRFFKKNASTYHIDSSRIVAGGYSSGAIASLMSCYFGEDILTPQVLTYYEVPGGYEGDQGNLGYSSVPAACFAIAGQIATYSNGDLNDLLSADKPALFGVCAANDSQVNCNISTNDQYLGYGANAYVDSARSYGMCADKYIFEGGNHYSGRDNYQLYIDQIDDFFIDIFENQCAGYVD